MLLVNTLTSLVSLFRAWLLILKTFPCGMPCWWSSALTSSVVMLKQTSLITKQGAFLLSRAVVTVSAEFGNNLRMLSGFIICAVSLSQGFTEKPEPSLSIRKLPGLGLPVRPLKLLVKCCTFGALFWKLMKITLMFELKSVFLVLGPEGFWSEALRLRPPKVFFAGRNCSLASSTVEQSATLDWSAFMSKIDSSNCWKSLQLTFDVPAVVGITDSISKCSIKADSDFKWPCLLEREKERH